MLLFCLEVLYLVNLLFRALVPIASRHKNYRIYVSVLLFHALVWIASGGARRWYNDYTSVPCTCADCFLTSLSIRKQTSFFCSVHLCRLLHPLADWLCHCTQLLFHALVPIASISLYFLELVWYFRSVHLCRLLLEEIDTRGEIMAASVPCTCADCF